MSKKSYKLNLITIHIHGNPVCFYNVDAAVKYIENTPGLIDPALILSKELKSKIKLRMYLYAL